MLSQSTNVQEVEWVAENQDSKKKVMKDALNGVLYVLFTFVL